MKKMSEMRRSGNARLILLAVLLVILAICWFVFEKFRIWILGLMALVLAGIGMEMAGKDVDLGKLVETGSVSESMITKTDKGTWLIGECEKKANFNCDNFAYQEEAQTLFEECGGVENDIHGLDRDKDGIVCESNKKRPEGEAAKSAWDILGWSSEQQAASAETEVEETDKAVDDVLDAAATN